MHIILILTIGSLLRADLLAVGDLVNILFLRIFAISSLFLKLFTSNFKYICF
jgi:hypothetical protein